MPLVVVGSVALDSIETPEETRENILGGSAVYFSCAASFFTPVRLVGVVGGDWPAEHTRLLQSRGVNVEGLQCEPEGKTFRWRGRYMENMNDRETVDVQLNTLAGFDPKLPEECRRAPFLFLANGSTETQRKALEQSTGATLRVADTMDLWIQTERKQLDELLQQIDGLVLNDSEARLLTGDENLVRAGNKVRQMGPRFVVIKKGEHGAMFFSRHETYVLPAFPTERVVDPTGAGDSFAGGMMGYLAEQDNFEPETLKTAMAYGILVASFTVEDFSLDRLINITRDDLDRRMEDYRRMLSF
ncbi:MAG: sugar kinase [Pirellulaceae bacterium]|jgi:sugar/nucleoside kinase (ribokinase family)|nr:PfkB family carbohydrate kinase [Thermoguttaceae bacterium]MDI9443359.1 PfkB family carbohydrate kinase [Planctomycetota bacterium]NLZ00139.1 sugar kinase [Pirellulaceae bacterium]